MASFSTRALLLAAVGGCALLSLRPASTAERALDAALTPLRVLSELARPVGLLRAREVRATERRVAELYVDELAERRALGADQLRFVLPDEEGLLRGRDFVFAEVVRRSPRDVDRLEVRVLSARDLDAGLEVGLPAVVGNSYVGRIVALTPTGALVDLVTRSDGFVGAVVGPLGERSRLVVGGVRPRPAAGEERLLAVRSPERARLPAGEVRVNDELSGSSHAALATGFRLGTLVVVDDQREEPTYAVRSPINHAAGIFQVALVRPRREGPSSGRGPTVDPLEDERWLSVRTLSCGDPLGYREGVVLAAGGVQGVVEGAAIVAGARLVGRVGRAGPLSSTARLLGDPGLALPVAALLEGRDEPLVLGWLVSLGRAQGRDGGHRVRFHWQEGWPEGRAGSAAGEGPVRARLFTGAGAAGVPPWLVLGEASLPREPGARVLEVDLAVDPRSLARLRVRLGEGETP